MKLLRLALLPFSVLYGSVLWLRNKLYDWKILPSRKAQIKTIVVGNLALGGTGKTPFIEYLIELFPQRHIAVLSRGYGRKTAGTVFAEPQSTAEDIGDEPLQIIRKFPEITLCVESDRLKGIDAIKAQNPDVEFIILDDAFQHRRLQGGFNILLTTFQKPFYRDYYIPSGTLRDHKVRARHADIVVVTKAPVETKEPKAQRIKSKLQYLKKPIFFSHLNYGKYMSLSAADSPENYDAYAAVTGIANPELFIGRLSREFSLEKHFKFPDHHSFNRQNLQEFREFIGNFAGGKLAFLTTEKDAMRLLKFEKELRDLDLHFFYLPVQVVFEEGKSEMERLLRNYIHGTR